MPTLYSSNTKKALTTLARCKLFMGISSDAYDGLITMLINQTTDFVERYCKRSFLSQAYTSEVYDGNGTDTLILKQFPVTAFSSLQYRNSNDNTDSWTTYNATSDYMWQEDGRVIFLGGKTIDFPKKYRATYTAGYLIDFDNENTAASHTLPGEIEYACQKLVSAAFNTRRAEGFQSTSQGDTSVTLKAKLHDDDETRAILDKYAAPTI